MTQTTSSWRADPLTWGKGPREIRSISRTDLSGFSSDDRPFAALQRFHQLCDVLLPAGEATAGAE